MTEVEPETPDESHLHQKHEQLLCSIYDDAEWLCTTLASSTYIEVPSHLRSIRNGLRHVLLDLGLLENHFMCESCRYSEHESKVAVAGQNECPDCGEILKRASTRRVSTDE